MHIFIGKLYNYNKYWYNIKAHIYNKNYNMRESGILITYINITTVLYRIL